MNLDRVAGAPITWGVSEVAGWGVQLSPARVLDEMAGLGLRATELGPPGFLPDDVDAARRLLAEHGLRLIAGFVPVVLHDADRWRAQRDRFAAEVRRLAALGGTYVVLAASSGTRGYDWRLHLGNREWRQLAASAHDAASLAADVGVTAVLHPHFGTVVDDPGSIETFLGLSDLPVCFDTGHVVLGGGDARALIATVADRVALLHLKDVDAVLAERVRSGTVSYRDAVIAGLWKPLGQGDADVRSVVEQLDDAQYDGWWVLEHDTVVLREPAAGAGPVVDAAASYRYLAELVGGPASDDGVRASASPASERPPRAGEVRERPERSR